MIAFFVFLAAIAWAIWVMMACLIATFLFLVQIVIEGILALSNRIEDDSSKTGG